MNREEIALKPCPFCGGKNIDPSFWARNDGKSGPGCDDCGATADSVEAWNTRAVLPSSLAPPLASQASGAPQPSDLDRGAGETSR